MHNFVTFSKNRSIYIYFFFGITRRINCFLQNFIYINRSQRTFLPWCNNLNVKKWRIPISSRQTLRAQISNRVDYSLRVIHIHKKEVIISHRQLRQFSIHNFMCIRYNQTLERLSENFFQFNHWNSLRFNQIRQNISRSDRW